ncbi:RNA polymerase sigma-70 factor [Flavivirga sp. Y03]|uniref:RNA polymerase sigma-70 factor n=1 Tax=Flavivirga algicola TaxID=2729136 RepID=A0ABX1RZP7_9FLAO|nr:RNA polymerase sigma-70 factor [Flavivirga algicola]
MKKYSKNIESNSFISLLQKGDMTAHEALFRLYYDKLLHIAKGYLGIIEDAEGVVQNVFLKIWEKKKNLEKVNNLGSYLHTMTKNACLDLLKHQRVKTNFSNNYYEERIAIRNQFIKDEAASLVIETELEERITRAIDTLPEKCKRVFLKSRFEGLKHSEIADIMHISKRTVDNHISNALQHMKLHLKEYLTLFIIFLKNF